MEWMWNNRNQDVAEPVVRKYIAITLSLEAVLLSRGMMIGVRQLLIVSSRAPAITPSRVTDCMNALHFQSPISPSPTHRYLQWLCERLVLDGDSTLTMREVARLEELQNAAADGAGGVGADADGLLRGEILAAELARMQAAAPFHPQMIEEEPVGAARLVRTREHLRTLRMQRDAMHTHLEQGVAKVTRLHKQQIVQREGAGARRLLLQAEGDKLDRLLIELTAEISALAELHGSAHVAAASSQVPATTHTPHSTHPHGLPPSYPPVHSTTTPNPGCALLSQDVTGLKQYMYDEQEYTRTLTEHVKKQFFNGFMARCAFSDRKLHSGMPLDHTHVRLKRAGVWPGAFLSGVHFSYQFTL
jgi:hypothetical protein